MAGLIQKYLLLLYVTSTLLIQTSYAQTDPILLQSTLVGFDLQNSLAHSIYKEEFRKNSRQVDSFKFESLTDSLQSLRKQVNQSISDPNVSFEKASQWIRAYFSNLQTYLSLLFHKRGALNIEQIQKDWSLTPSQKLANQMGIYSDPSRSRFDEDYYAFRINPDQSLVFTPAAVKQITTQNRLLNPTKKDFFELASYLLYREKIQSFEVLENLIPFGHFEKPRIDPNFLKRFHGFPNANEIQSDIKLTQSELKFRSDLISEFNTIFKTSFPPGFESIADSLFENSGLNSDSLELKKELKSAFIEYEKQNIYPQLSALIQNHGNLLHSLPKEDLKTELKTILASAIAQATRKVFEWEVAYFENESMIEAINLGEISSSHPSAQKAKAILDQLQKNPLLRTIIRLEVTKELSFWENIEKVESIYHKLIGKIKLKIKSDLIDEWIEKTYNTNQTSTQVAQSDLVSRILDAAETVSKGLKKKEIDLMLYHEFVYLRLFESSKTVSPQVQGWLSRLSQAKTYQKARDIYLELISQELSSEIIQDGYLDVRKLLLYYNDLFQSKKALSDLSNFSEFDRYLNAHAFNQKSADLWQLIRIGTWYAFHIPTRHVQPDPKRNPELQKILLSATDRYRYKALFRKALANSISTVYRILFVKIDYQDSSITLREAIIKEREKLENQASHKLNSKEFEMRLIENLKPSFVKAGIVVRNNIQRVFDLLSQAKTVDDLFVPLSSSYFAIMILRSFPEMSHILTQVQKRAALKGHIHQIREKLHSPIFWGLMGDLGLRLVNLIGNRLWGKPISMVNWIINGKFYLNHIHKPLLRLFWVELYLSYDVIYNTESLKDEMRELFFFSRPIGAGDYFGREYWTLKQALGDQKFHFLAFQVGVIGVIFGVQGGVELYRLFTKPLQIRKAYGLLGAIPGDMASVERRILQIRNDQNLSSKFLQRSERAYQLLKRKEFEYAQKLVEMTK